MWAGQVRICKCAYSDNQKLPLVWDKFGSHLAAGQGLICPGGGTESLARSAKDAVEPPGQRARSFRFAHLGFLGTHALPRELQDQRVMHEPASQRNSRRVRQQKLEGAADRVFRSNFERSVRFISASLDGGKLWAALQKSNGTLRLRTGFPIAARRSRRSPSDARRRD